MARKLLCVMITLTSLCAYAQDGYIQIPGTRVSMKAPEGFEVISGFTGLRKGETSMIQVFDLNGGNFYTNAASFSKDEFEKKDMEVLSFTDIKVGGFPAKLAHMQGGNGEAKVYSMVFGDSTFSVMMMGMYAGDDQQTEKDIKDALLSARYDKDKKVDPFESVNFKLDDSKSKLKFGKASGNMFIYTMNGEEKAKNGPVVIVISVPLEETTKPRDLAEQMVAGLKNKGFANMKITDKAEIKINGCDGYSMKLVAKKDGKEATVFIQSFVKNNTAVIIQGISQGNADADIAEIKALSATLQIK